MKTFAGGVYPPHKKDSSLINPIKTASVPSIATIPLIQHIGAPAKAIVKAGDTVNVGTKIGEAEGFISSNIHASVSGRVKRIDIFPHPVLGYAPAIEIESDGSDRKDDSIIERNNVDELSAQDIVNIVKEAGIVGLGGAAFPTHVKLSPPPSKKIETVIINGAECEPYLTCDHMSMLFRPLDILKGCQLVTKAVGAKKCYIGIEENKMDAFELLMSKVRGKSLDTIIPVRLKVKYPQGAEKQLIKAILNKEVPLRALPMDVGVVVQNIATVIAIYEAVYLGKPLYERLLTVCGRSVKNQQNVIVRIGTTFEEAIQSVGGLINTPDKLIMGGPMMGLAQARIDVPVIKATSGILTINPNEFIVSPTRPCIRCGKCADICPMGLLPSTITLAGEAERYDRSEKYGVRDCVECGSCAYICPAKRPMVHSIKMIKNELMKIERKKEKKENA